MARLLNSLNCILRTACLACLVTPALGQEFRIESQVYMSDSTQPVAHNVTLYTPKLVCDYRMSDELNPQPIEIVVYDPHERLVVLLDPKREIRVDLPDSQILKLVEGLRRETLQSEQAKFLLNDMFEEDTDWSGGWVTLTSPSMTYRLKGEQPKDVSLMPAYFESLDVFTRLSASDPTRIPPFPRLRLNQTIRKTGWIPTEVQIAIQQNDFFHTSFTAHSKHVLTEGISNKDRELIAQTKKHWMQFRAVDLAKYRGLSNNKQKHTTATTASGKMDKIQRK